MSKQKNNKVLFLDHDGVICLGNNFGSRYKKQRKVYNKNNPRPLQSELPYNLRFDNFDKKAVKVLNSIIKETDCEVVVSSDWRYHCTLEEMGLYYKEQGIIKPPIGFTEKLKDFDPSIWQKKFRWYAKLEEERSLEIKHWLSKNPDVNSWVAVDDLNMSNFLSNFVFTPKYLEGVKQSGVKDKVLSFLK